MKFTCDKAALSEAVIAVSPAVSQKSTLLALECVLLRCKSGHLSVIGYNLELGITKDLEVQSFQDGDIIFNARLFSEIIAKMPAGELSFTTDDKLLTVIRGGGVQFTILGMSADEYPELPVISKTSTFSIPVKILRSMIAETMFAISQDTTRPFLTGTLFENKNGMLHLVSTDTSRLALRREPVDFSENFRFVVPGRTLSETLKLTGRLASDDEDAPVQIGVGDRHIVFECGGYKLLSRLLEGEFINYKNAIPKESLTNVRIDTKAFLDSINRASVIINERAKSHIRCSFMEGEVKLFCETPLGKINDSVAIECDGPEVVIGFNNRYMADALKASECDKLCIQMNGPISPMKIVPVEDDNFLFLVLPVRLKN